MRPIGMVDTIRAITSADCRLANGVLIGPGLTTFERIRLSFRSVVQVRTKERIAALWTYFTIPILYTYPGFVAEELPPWEENGETWRPLAALFPEEIASHAQKQISYFGPDGLLRRHEYTVDVLGGAKGV